MLNFKFLPIHFTLFLVLGIIIGYFFEFSLGSLFIAALIVVLGLILFNNKAKLSFDPPVLFTVFTAISFLFIGMISIQLQKPIYQKRHFINHYTANDQVVIKIRSILKPSKMYQKYEAKVIRVDNIKTIGSILVNINKGNLKDSLKVDDVILTYNPLQEINKALNPNEFDYREFLKKKGIYRQIRLKKGKYLFLGNGEKTLRGYAYKLRVIINKALKKYHFSASVLAIINAIILGQRQNISSDLFESYKNAGAIHILAVSGLHIGIILLLLNLLFKPLEKIKNGKTIKLLLVIFCLWVYAFIAGMSASIIRAVTMFTAIAIGWMSDRPSNVKNSLIVSFFFLLLIHPLFLFDVGFQLSYTAVFSIVLIQPLLVKLWKPKGKLIHYFWQLLTVSFAAQIGILPLSLYYFHQFPGLFFISSLVIIPFLGIIIGLGILFIILALLHILPQFLADLYSYIISFMNYFVDLIAHQESFVFHDIFFSLVLLFVFYFFLITVVNFVMKRSASRLLFILLAVIFIQMSFIYEKKQSQKTNEFIVFHQIKNSIIAISKQSKIHFYHNSNSIEKHQNRVIKTYLSSQFSQQEAKHYPLRNVYKYDNKLSFIVDSSGIYADINIPEMIILSQSPKINLERLIQVLHPKLIIADGSNYNNYTKRWEETCKMEQVDFYNTSVNGAFVYVYSP